MKSIKVKIWLAILGVTFIVILLIWFSQVVLLEKIYLVEKESKLYSDTQQICTTIQDEGLESTITQLSSLVSSENYSIEITSMQSRQTFSAQPEGSQNILNNLNNLKVQVLQEVYSSAYGTIISKQALIGNNTEIYLLASMQSVEDETYLIFVGATLAPVREAVSTIQGQLIFISIFLILLACVVSFVIANSLTKPVIELTNGVREIASGKLDTKVHIKSKDEFGRLGSDFNIMSKEIAKADSFQRELIANVSHDIRTPLTMIKGYAEIIKDLTGDNKLKRDEQLDIIIDESNRLNTLVNDMLDLSKLQSNQLVLNYQQFDLSQKIRDVMRRYNLLIVNEGYDFTLIAPSKALVYADEVKIEQVLYNIINNATNHTGADKKVTIVLEKLSDRAVVKIIDTGKGIEPEYIPLIWERYYKPYKKNDRKGMGTGLGLSIVKGILETHGFNFGVDSTLNKGSCFWFEVHNEFIEK